MVRFSRHYRTAVPLVFCAMAIAVSCRGSSPATVQDSSQPAPTPVQVRRNPAGIAGSVFTILVIGHGASSESARQDAFRKAIENVVGVYLDAQTIVQNRQVVEDKVLSLANGFVDGYDVIEETNENGQVVGRYKVRVRTSPIFNALSAIDKSGTEINLDDLSASASSQIERNRRIHEGLLSLLREHPRKSIVATPVNFGLAGEVGLEDNVEVQVDIAFQWNQSWLYRLSRFLSAANTPGAMRGAVWMDSFNDPLNYSSRGLGSNAEGEFVSKFKPAIGPDIATAEAEISEAILRKLFYAVPFFKKRDGGDYGFSIGWYYPITSVAIGFYNRGRRIYQYQGALPYHMGISPFEYYLQSFTGTINGNVTLPLQQKLGLDRDKHDLTLIIASPQNPTMGIGTIYRFKGTVPVSLMDNFDEIRVEVQ